MSRYDNIPGGRKSINSNNSGEALSTSTIICDTILLRSGPSNSIVYWGLSDMTVASIQRGYMLAGEWVLVTGPLSPADIYVWGTQGDNVYWTGDIIR